jgi:ubiquinone/menaquinone biosynthesis C-methylase UbiE
MNSNNLESVPTRGRTLDYAAKLYDALIPIVSFGKDEFYFKETLKILELKKDDNILDLGCGTGHLSQFAHSLVPDGAITGIDAAGKMIQIARNKEIAPNAFFDVAAAEKLPYDDNSFDKVCSLFFYHHIDKELKELSIKEAFRVLKPGGIFVIVDIDKPTTLFGTFCILCGEVLFHQPEIKENRLGVLNDVLKTGPFKSTEKLNHYLGYVSLFKMVK